MDKPIEVTDATWITVEAEAAHYIDQGITTVLCDRLPRPLTLVLKNPVLRDGGSLVAQGAARAAPLAGRRGAAPRLGKLVCGNPEKEVDLDLLVRDVNRTICANEPLHPHNTRCDLRLLLMAVERLATDRHRLAHSTAPTGDDYGRGLEDAAKVAETWRFQDNTAFVLTRESGEAPSSIIRNGIAKAIRALKSPMDNPTQPEMKGEGR